tara:strand:+ start:3832 stop:4242 length:411 start_codon:yes stop_codon:yes gene_type:complete
MLIQDVIILYILVISLFILICIILHLRWFIDTIRDIASYKNPGGYFKLIQVFLIFIICMMLIIVFVYYLLVPGTVDRVDLFLTVIVGWMGMILGRFFGEIAMEDLMKTQSVKRSRTEDNFVTVKNIIQELKEELRD